MIEPFLADAGWQDAHCAPLAGDASARRYLRLSRRGRSAVLMIAPVGSPAEQDSLDAFLRVADYLQGLDLAAPEIFAADRDAGLILMEDFSDLSLARLLERGDAAEAYRQAAEIPILLAQASPPGWAAAPDFPAQAAMIALTYDLLPDASELSADIQKLLCASLAENAGGPSVLSLRDYHADNLIWRPDQAGASRIGLLDFQDAVRLPAGYDLASLVDDPRRVVPTALRADLIARFATAQGISNEVAALRTDTLSVLRNLRILGIFHRLSETGKPTYRTFLPRTKDLLRRAVGNPQLAALQGPVLDTLARTRSWTEAGAE